jgi:purine-nucleoside phosphorylase
MTASQLIERLKEIPGHLPVHVEVPDVHGTDIFYTLDCEMSSFPTQGRMAVITLNMEPK